MEGKRGAKRSSRYCIARYCAARYRVVSSEAFRWILDMVVDNSARIKATSTRKAY